MVDVDSRDRDQDIVMNNRRLRNTIAHVEPFVVAANAAIPGIGYAVRSWRNSLFHVWLATTSSGPEGSLTCSITSRWFLFF